LQIERGEGILQLFRRDVQIELDAIPNLNDADAANLGKRGKAAKPYEHLPAHTRCPNSGGVVIQTRTRLADVDGIGLRQDGFPLFEHLLHLRDLLRPELGKGRAHRSGRQTDLIHHFFHDRNFVASPAGTQGKTRCHIFLNDLREHGGIPRRGSLMKLQRKLGSNCGNAGGLGTDTDTVIRGYPGIARPADPVQTIAYAVHDLLIAVDVALTVFPTDQSRNSSRYSFDPCRERVHPVTAVDDQAQGRRRADRRIVIPPRRRSDNTAVGLGFHPPQLLPIVGPLDCDRRIEARAADDGNLATYLFYDGSYYGHVLARGQRVHFARAPCSYDRCNRMPKKPLDIVPKASHIQRQIRIERSDRKGNHSA
jgi:hypothetical protein